MQNNPREASSGAESPTPTVASTQQKSSSSSTIDPPFTINDVRAAIPEHCFQRDLKKSFTYVAVDLAIVSALFFAATYISTFSWYLQLLLWPTYWILQGFTLTGVWVLAHECGHQAFSESKTINNVVGLILHSALLVPYHSWRFTHGLHHKGTNHMKRDQVFIPATFSKVLQDHSLWEDTPMMNLYKLVTMVVLGWPAYLMFNVLSQTFPGQRANHFEPWSPLFKPSQRMDIVISDAGLAVMLAVIYMWVQWAGWSSVIFYYGIPYLNVNFWLVTITYLQHTHVDVPHYEADEWTNLKGALATVDRDFGILNVWFHHIQDTHVLHHLFSAIPHYHAEEATRAIKPLLGKFYRFDGTPVLKALWETRRHCKYVPDEGSVLFYKTNVKD